MMSETAPTRRAILRTVGGSLLSTGAVGCLNLGRASDREVRMTDGFAYEPMAATVERGETLTWRNVGEVDHTVTAYQDELPDGAAYFASGGFESETAARNQLTQGLIDGGETYQHTFEQPGSYRYFCIPHEDAGMVGTVEVR